MKVEMNKKVKEAIIVMVENDYVSHMDDLWDSLSYKGGELYDLDLHDKFTNWTNNVISTEDLFCEIEKSPVCKHVKDHIFYDILILEQYLFYLDSLRDSQLEQYL